MPEHESAGWDQAFAVILAEAESGDAWDAVRQAAKELSTSLSSPGEGAAEWQMLLDGDVVLRAARNAIVSSRLDAGLSLLELGPDLKDQAKAVAALSSRDLELVVALCGSSSASSSRASRELMWLLAERTVGALLERSDREAHALALHLMAWVDDDPRSRASQKARADRAAVHGFQYADEYALVNRTVVGMCQRRRKGADASIFESCSASLGSRVMDFPSLIAESARCAQICIARGSRRVLHYETAITFALLEGRVAEAEACKATMLSRYGGPPSVAHRGAATVEVTWKRASEAVADLRARRGPAGLNVD